MRLLLSLVAVSFLVVVGPASAASLTYDITVTNIVNTTSDNSAALGFVVDMLPINDEDFLFSAQGNIFGLNKGELDWNTTLGSGPNEEGTNNFPTVDSFSSVLTTSQTSLTFDIFDLGGDFLKSFSYTLPTVSAPTGTATTIAFDFTNSNGATELDEFTFQAKAVVPEPATWLVLTVGGAWLWGRLRNSQLEG